MAKPLTPENEPCRQTTRFPQGTPVGPCFVKKCDGTWDYSPAINIIRFDDIVAQSARYGRLHVALRETPDAEPDSKDKKDGKIGGSFPDIVYPAPLQTPRIDFDVQRRKRIKKWISNYVVPNYENGVDENDLDEILLDFEKFLMEEEARRLQQSKKRKPTQKITD